MNKGKQSKNFGEYCNLWLSNFRLLILIVVFLVVGISTVTALKIKVDSTSVKVDTNVVKIDTLQRSSIEQKVLLEQIKESQKEIKEKIDRLIERLIP